MPTIADIIKSAQDPDEDLTDTTDKDNDEQESMKISMDMGLEYGTKFLAFLEQQEEGINEENVISFREILKIVDKLVLGTKKQAKITDFFN